MANICIDCEKGVHECCFMRDLTPVNGWKAKKVRYNAQDGTHKEYTYDVKACPGFKVSTRKTKPKYHEKICPRCKQKFIPHSSNQKYCSDFCRRVDAFI